MSLKETCNRIAKNKEYKRAKRIMLFFFIVLLLFDIVLVFSADSGFPTISRVVLHATPKFVVIVWFFGLLTGNIFFPRTKPEVKIAPIFRLLILVSIGCSLLLLGYRVNSLNAEKSCSQNLPGSSWVWSFLRAECISKDSGKLNFVDCFTLDQCQCESTVNFSTDANLVLFLFGMFCGFVFWPQLPESSAHCDEFF